MVEVGDMRFNCPHCPEPVTVPVRSANNGDGTFTLAASLGVIREHFETVHPELADPATESNPSRGASCDEP